MPHFQGYDTQLMRLGEGGVWIPHYTRWLSQEKKKKLKRVGIREGY
jgi:hypothetical protein